MRLVEWVRQRDRGFSALRRAGRAAIVMPSLFALGTEVIGNADVATFAAFGSFAMLLLVDFTGPMLVRLQAYAALAAAGAAFICVGTLAGREPWLAATSMAIVAFAVLFAGVVSSVLAGATPALLLAYILPVSLPGSASTIPDRLAGWGLASAATLVAVSVLWPAPARDPLRAPAASALQALADRLRADVAYLLAEDGTSADDREQAAVRADEAVASLRRDFLAAPYRPTGLSTSARTVVRLVDELQWLAQTVRIARPSAASARHVVNPAVLDVKRASADLLECASELLVASPDGDALEAFAGRLRIAVTAMEDRVSSSLPRGEGLGVGRQAQDGGSAREVVTALDPTFRAQELGFAVAQIADNVALTAAADRRSWLDRVLGRQPAGVSGAWTAAQERGAAHLEWSSVWLQNSIRGGVGLGVAVFIAEESGVQHSFWVVLGTLSVLRSNALNTGQNIVRGLIGTAAGFLIGSALLAVIGTKTAVLWALLPPAVLVAGFLPAAISFAAGQAAFTVTLVILFNLIAPAGWQVGLLRVEDVAIGCAVSLVVGLLFWPRGAGAALGRAVASAYSESVRYLAAAIAYGMVRCDPRGRAEGQVEPPADSAIRAAAASRRLDDAYRNYLAERGAKPASLADITGLVNGVVGLRLVGDAVLDLWHRDDGSAVGDRAAAQREILGTTERVVSWYDGLSASVLSGTGPPEPLGGADLPDGQLVEALRRDLLEPDNPAAATAARMIWTGDYLDAVRRLQAGLVGPARDAAQHGALAAPAGILARLR